MQQSKCNRNLIMMPLIYKKSFLSRLQQHQGHQQVDGGAQRPIFQAVDQVTTFYGEAAILCSIASSLVCLCCRAQTFTNRRSLSSSLCYYALAVLGLPLPWRWTEHLLCSDLLIVYHGLTHQMAALHLTIDLTVDLKIRLYTLNWKRCEIPCDILS